MEIGSKIKQLRIRMGLTQEQLAEELGISAQSVSKWETAVTMPDVMLLPKIAEVLGVSIDELFDLTVEQKLNRIENRMEIEEELSRDVFYEYEDYLSDLLTRYDDKRRVMSMLAHLYHHRMQSDARKVSRYARAAMCIEPAKKECQWLLNMAEQQEVWDWNIGNHAKVIDFYKELITSDVADPKTPLPYYYLIDNLLADNRTIEARHYLDEMAKLPKHNAVMIEVYEAYIALHEYDVNRADAIMSSLAVKYATNGIFLFEAAQYYARKCDYEKAIEYYERSYAYETHKPRYYDALQGIAIIQEIQGKYKEAAATYDRILDNLRVEWGFTEEVCVKEAEEEKARLLNLAK